MMLQLLEKLTFEVRDKNGALVAVRSAVSNASSIAVAEYRLPWPDVNPERTFGEWSISVSVEALNEVCYDQTCFVFTYLLFNNGVSTYAVGGEAASSFSRDGQLMVELAVDNVRCVSMSCVVCITVYDENNVPVVVAVDSLEVLACSSGVVSFIVSLPHFAYVGQARLFVNVLSALPSGGGVAFCPEDSTTQILLTA